MDMQSSKLLSVLLLAAISLILTTTATRAQIYFGGDEQLKVTDVNGLNPTEFLDEEITGIAIDTTRRLLFFSNVSFFSNQIVEKISLDGTGREEILNTNDLGVNDMSPRGIALDEKNMVVYVADLLNDGRILSVNYDGTNPQVVIAGEADGVTKGILDVAVDTVNNKLYWPKLNAIMRSDLDGNNMEMIAEVDPVPGQEDNPVQVSVIQVDPVGGKIYWADPYKNQITIADLDGSNKEVLIETNRSPEGLHLDLANQRLFYLDDASFRGEATAYYADLDGANVTEIAVYDTPTFDTGPMVVYNYEIATSTEQLTDDRPDHLELNQNYPNPFNPETQISFSLSEPGMVRLEVFNSLGQQVAVLLSEKTYSSGTHSIIFDASGFSSGIYYYRLSTNGITLTRSMTLLK
jgi:hypothetical protein